VPTETDRLISDALRRKEEFKRPDRVAGRTGTFFLKKEEKVTLVSGAAAVANWTRVDCAPYVPTDATGVVLEVIAFSSTAPSNDRRLQIRREEGYVEYVAARTIGTTVGDLTSDSNTPICELSGDKTFDYKSSAMNDFSIALIGYYIN
jgi:hypothetical protein